MPEITSRLLTALADRYRLERRIGEGGMATVYLAEDLKHRRKVAVKVLRPELAAVLGAERFLKEIEVTANLQHPHILPLHDSGEADGFLYYVMPFVDGASLRGVMNQKRQLELEYVRQLANEVAGALDYAHRQGVLHRDIKPENILLSEGHAVVADFGIAKAISRAGGDNLTRTGVALGTPGYMSPEQAAGSTQVDARNDVFSLACVIYEMLTGETPGLWPTEEAIRVGRFLDAPPAHREALDRLPVAIEQALTKAMAMRADNRFATPGELAQALADHPGGSRKYDTQQVKDIVQRAANAEVHHPTDHDALTLGTVQRIGAEVGIRPERIKDAAAALDPWAKKPGKGGGLLGGRSKIDLELVLDREVTEEQYEEVLAEIRGAMGEVGRLNQTLGKSLSWNSLSFQNTLEGSGRLTHVMISPSGGKTRIRITEGGGQHFALLASVVFVGFMGGALLTRLLGIPEMMLPIMGGALGGSFLVGRNIFGRLIARRHRVLNNLLDRISATIADPTSTPADRALPPTDHE